MPTVGKDKRQQTGHAFFGLPQCRWTRKQHASPQAPKNGWWELGAQGETASALGAFPVPVPPPTAPIRETDRQYAPPNASPNSLHTNPPLLITTTPVTVGANDRLPFFPSPSATLGGLNFR